MDGCLRPRIRDWRPVLRRRHAAGGRMARKPGEPSDGERESGGEPGCLGHRPIGRGRPVRLAVPERAFRNDCGKGRYFGKLRARDPVIWNEPSRTGGDDDLFSGRQMSFAEYDSCGHMIASRVAGGQVLRTGAIQDADRKGNCYRIRHPHVACDNGRCCEYFQDTHRSTAHVDSSQ